MYTPAASTMRRDIISAYAASGARVVAWAIVSAILYRRGGAHALGLFALIRATMGLLSYTSLGLAPAIIRFMAKSETTAVPIRRDDAHATVLSYETAAFDPGRAVYSNGLLVGAGAAFFGGVATLAVALLVAGDARLLVLHMGIGTVFRMLSEVPGAVLQARQRIALDNQLLLGADIGWAVIVCVSNVGAELALAGFGFLVANGLLFLGRSLNAARLTNLLLPDLRVFDPSLAWQLLTFGLLVTLGQVADFLYAPTDFILINHYLGTVPVAIYTPAVQIDSALLLLDTGLASVLLPKAARAHASGDAATVTRYYIMGTLSSVAIVSFAAAGVWLLSPRIFRLWLDDPMVLTQAILPLVLIHTVIGGSSAVGRSILLGMGKVKPFAVAALISGIGNVILSVAFVKAGFGLRGIIYGTIIAVVGRCAIWMPWYVLRTIRSMAVRTPLEDLVVP